MAECISCNEDANNKSRELGGTFHSVDHSEGMVDIAEGLNDT